MGPEILEPLAAGYAALPPYEDGQHIDDQRRPLHAMLASVREQVTPYPTVDVEDVSVPGPAGDLALRIYRPHTPSSSRPGIYLIHGGAMVLGNLDFDHLPALMLCEITGAVIVSVDYRLAPEHPYPAALDDCMAGLRWMGRHATILEINEDRLAMFGLSAGGGLALATGLRVRDEGGPDLCFVMAPYPMIDDRPHLAAQDLIALAWEPYLGGREADTYAAPSREVDLTGLPPTFIDVGDQDLFLHEAVDFAARLMQAGVSTELHVYPGADHASEIFDPSLSLSRQIWDARFSALARALS